MLFILFLSVTVAIKLAGWPSLREQKQLTVVLFADRFGSQVPRALMINGTVFECPTMSVLPCTACTCSTIC